MKIISMKKLLTLCTFALTVLLSASCEKTYNCKCPVYNPVTGQTEYTNGQASISSLNPKDYKNVCKSWGEDCIREKL